MGAATHTPGQWFVKQTMPELTSDRGEQGKVILIEVGDPADPSVLAMLPILPGFLDELTVSANARLIAAAPELLAASRLALDALQDAWGFIGDLQIGFVVEKARLSLEAAIARAVK